MKRIGLFLASPLGRFTKRTSLCLGPLLLLWWLGSGWMLGLLRPSADLLAGFLHMSDAVTEPADHDWVAHTELLRASGVEPGPVLIAVPAAKLRRLLVSFPLFLAVMIAAPPNRPWLKGALGLAILGLVFAFSACGILFNSFCVIVNHQPSLTADNIPPPPFTVTHAPFNGATTFLAALWCYLAMQFVPLAAPVGLWAAMSGRRLAALSPTADDSSEKTGSIGQSA